MSDMPPLPLQWIVRRLHNGANRWTRARIAGKSDRRFGWSAWSHVRAQQGWRIAVMLEQVIDALFWPGHCREDYARIMADEPLVVEWRHVWATARVLAILAICAAIVALAVLGVMI
jgi:RNA:NAD 2'-phosphotransferase (TPT1/KptA family)